MEAVVEPAGAGMSQVARVVDTYVAPSKTFEDLRRNASWWLPLILVFVTGFGYAAMALNVVGIPTMADNLMRTIPRVQQAIADNPDQAPVIRQKIENQIKGGFYWGTLVTLIVGFAVAGLFVASANFLFGGTGSYKQMLAVFWYSVLPLVVFNVLVCVMLAARVNVDTYQVNNPIATNVGYFLLGGGSSPGLVAAASLLDVFSLWIFLLQSLGVSKVAKISFGKACVAVGIWWVLYSAVKVLPAVLFS